MHTPNLLTTLGVLTLLTAIIAAGVVLIRALRVDLQRLSKRGSVELLRDLEAAYRKGQMDTAEFERVRRSLDEQRSGRASGPAAHAPLAQTPAEPTGAPASLPSEPERTPAADPPAPPPEGTTGSAREA